MGVGKRWGRRYGVLAAGLVVASAVAACSSSSGGAAEDSSGTPHQAGSGSVQITDATGRDLTIKTPVERIAILDRGPAEILSGFGVLDKLVGIHESLKNDPLYPQVQGKPVVATWSEVNFEALAQAQPNVVLTSSEGGHGAITDDEHLSDFDIVDIKTNLRDPRTMSEEITALGKVFGQEAKAQQMVDFYDKYTKLITDRVKDIPDSQRPRVFLQTHPGLLNTGGKDSAWYQQIVLAGGINISESLSGLPEVDGEWVAKQNPDIIIVEGSELGFAATSGESTDAPQLRDEVMTAGGVKDTNAVTNGKVWVMPIDIISRPGYIIGEIYMAKMFYPDLFTDIDPAKVHSEYLSIFHPGTDYSGSWVYPAVP